MMTSKKLMTGISQELAFFSSTANGNTSSNTPGSPAPSEGANVGFILGLSEIPESVLESVLLCLPNKDILTCRMVCVSWKNIIESKSFWKRRFEKYDKNWNSVPSPVIEKTEAWMMFNAQFCHSVFSKNFIKNPSGHHLEGWTTNYPNVCLFHVSPNGETLMFPTTRVAGRNSNRGWHVDTEISRVIPLPNDDFFGDDTSCFYRSTEMCSKYYEIDIFKEGLPSPLLKACLPLEIKCSQLCTSEFENVADGLWKLQLLDSDRKILQENEVSIHLSDKHIWHKVEHSFKFYAKDILILERIHYLRFIRATDFEILPFLNVHGPHIFGMRFARACVTLECLTNK